MTKIYYRIFLIIFAFIAANFNPAFGQKDSSKLNKEVEVIKPYRPNISTANKLNQLPDIEDTTRFTPEFNYSIDNKPINTGFKTGPLSIQDIKTEKDQDSGIGYLKVGAGIYNTTLGDFYLNDNKLKNASLGIHLKHLASQGTTRLSKGDLVDSPYSNNSAEIFGSQILGGSTLSGNLSYDRDAFRYYGYSDTVPTNPALRPPLFGAKQVFQKAEFQVGLKSNEENDSKLKYKSGLWYHYFDTKTGHNENTLGLLANFDYQFEKFKGTLETSYEHLTTKGIQDTSLNNYIDNKREDWLIITPLAEFSGDKWSIKGGFSFYSAASSIIGEGDIKIYPKIDFKFSPVKDIFSIYAGVNGYLEKGNYETISYENYWVNPIHNVLNADHQIILTGGLKGKINKELNYKLELKYESIKDMHFYALRPLSTTPPIVFNNSFDVVYDNAGIASFSAELTYVKGLDYYFSLKGNYYNYTLDRLPFTPDLANFDITGSANVRLNNKLTGFADFKVTGQRYGLMITSAGDKKVELKPLHQLNLGAEYALKPKLKIFGRADNLLNQHYEQWLGYFTQGLRLVAGVVFSF